MEAGRAQGIVLIGFGSIWTLIVLAGLGVCLGPSGSGCGLLFAPFVVIGLALIGLGIYRVIAPPVRWPSMPPGFNPAVPPPLITPVVVQQTTEVVRVRCRYCGALGDPTQVTCRNCGAPL